MLAIVVGFLGYNIKYNSLIKENERIKKENSVWQKEVERLKKLSSEVLASKSLKFYQRFYFDEIFSNESSFNLSPSGEVILKEIIPLLQEFQDNIMLVGYFTDELLENVPAQTFKLSQEVALKKALRVGEFLNSWGIKKERLIILGVGKLESIFQDSTLHTEFKKGYLEIVIQ
ncbi:MAG: hypothetical protein NZ601_01320 [candidate division WOR-3 bacterium]|nr:hypothetical protein [candidate division WOR-3 bacterium]MDW7987306.1 hypothetical protein [candidate division WOR-3 bacterium]